MGIVPSLDGAEVKAVYEVVASAFTDAQFTKLAAISGTNTGDEPDAGAGVKGIVELATPDEAVTGTDATRAVTPAGLAALHPDMTKLNNMRDNGKFFGRKTAAQGTTGTFADVTTWAATDEAGSDYSFNVTTGILTLNTVGLYRIGYNLLGENTADQRAGLEAKMRLNSGSGYADLPQSLSGAYARLNALQNYAAASCETYMLRATGTGWRVKLQIQDTGQSLDVEGYLSAERIDD